MTHDEMIAVIQHHRDGGKVEYQNSGDQWCDCGSPSFDFARVKYRIKPEPRSLWISFNDYGKPHLSAESADQADYLARIKGRKFFLFQEVLP